MSVWTRVPLGLAVAAVAGYGTGRWGSGGGIAAMVAGVVGIGLPPLAVDWINQRKAPSAVPSGRASTDREPPDRIEDE